MTVLGRLPRPAGPDEPGSEAAARTTGASGVGFTTFAVFYMVAFVLDATEEWDPGLPALAFLVAVVAMYILGVTRLRFVAFLVASSAYILLVHFPDPGNHNNVFLLCNVFLLAGIAWGSRRPDTADDDALFERLKPPLRISLAVIYVFAGFHKLNRDFFEPAFGCADEFFQNVYSLTPFPALALPTAGVVGLGVAVIAWELGGGLLLWFRRTQPVMLALSLVNHAVLALVQFFDFSSLAFALLLLFIPAAHWRLVEESPVVRIGRLRVRRLGLYVYVNAAMALAAGLYIARYGWEQLPWQGLALDAALLIVLWPILVRLVRGPRPRWAGVPMWTPRVPRWAVALPLVVLFIGVNPYLGLRTAGTYTMFSNLQIQGDTSNHLLLGSNPFAIWGLQDDAVHVIDIDGRHTGDPDRDLTRTYLPRLEFEKRIVEWRRRGLEGLGVTFEYDGRTYRSDDVVRDNPFDVDGYRPVHYLVDFGQVQESGPVPCRW